MKCEGRVAQKVVSFFAAKMPTCFVPNGTVRHDINWNHIFGCGHILRKNNIVHVLIWNTFGAILWHALPEIDEGGMA